jgi:hypothetical protein
MESLMRIWIALVLLLSSVSALGQRDHSPYPERFNVCSAPNDCIVVTKQGDAWVGLVDGDTKPAWNFTIDDFRLDALQLTGTSMQKDAAGNDQTVVVRGKPEGTVNGFARCKARYTIGRKSTSRKVTVTWPSTFKIPNGNRL